MSTKEYIKDIVEKVLIRFEENKNIPLDIMLSIIRNPKIDEDTKSTIKRKHLSLTSDTIMNNILEDYLLNLIKDLSAESYEEYSVEQSQVNPITDQLTKLGEMKESDIYS